MTIIGISGSLRHGSFNTALLHAAAEIVLAHPGAVGYRKPVSSYTLNFFSDILIGGNFSNP